MYLQTLNMQILAVVYGLRIFESFRYLNTDISEGQIKKKWWKY